MVTMKSQKKMALKECLVWMVLLLTCFVSQSFRMPYPLRVNFGTPYLQPLSMAAQSSFDWNEINHSLQSKMTKCIDSVRTKYTTIRTNGAHPSMLDRVYINYFGSHQPLHQLAHIKIASQSELTVEPYDLALLKDIEQGILSADLNLSPVNDGKSIRIRIPPLSEERRKELVKVAKQMNEEGKISLRGARRETIDIIKECEKNKLIGKDDSKNYQECTQKATEEFVKKLDTLFKLKEKDLLSL